MRILTILLVLLVSACAYNPFLPEQDVCAQFSTKVEQTYCYVSEGVTAINRATLASLKEGSITREDAERIREVTRKADDTLEVIETLIISGDDDEAAARLLVVKQLLLEVQ